MELGQSDTVSKDALVAREEFRSDEKRHRVGEPVTCDLNAECWKSKWKEFVKFKRDIKSKPKRKQKAYFGTTEHARVIFDDDEDVLHIHTVNGDGVKRTKDGWPDDKCFISDLLVDIVNCSREKNQIKVIEIGPITNSEHKECMLQVFETCRKKLYEDEFDLDQFAHDELKKVIHKTPLVKMIKRFSESMNVKYELDLEQLKRQLLEEYGLELFRIRKEVEDEFEAKSENAQDDEKEQLLKDEESEFRKRAWLVYAPWLFFSCN